MGCFAGEARCSTDADLVAAGRIYMIRCPKLSAQDLITKGNRKMNSIKHQKRREERRMNLAKSDEEASYRYQCREESATRVFWVHKREIRANPAANLVCQQGAAP